MGQFWDDHGLSNRLMRLFIGAGYSTRKEAVEMKGLGKRQGSINLLQYMSNSSKMPPACVGQSRDQSSSNTCDNCASLLHRCRRLLHSVPLGFVFIIFEIDH